MDDFSVYGDSFASCLSHLEKMLKQCEDTNLVLNKEKFHFMVKEGIFLGHKISKPGLNSIELKSILSQRYLIALPLRELEVSLLMPVFINDLFKTFLRVPGL